MEKPVNMDLNDTIMEEEISHMMEELNVEEVERLLEGCEGEKFSVSGAYMEDIKKMVSLKSGVAIPLQRNTDGNAPAHSGRRGQKLVAAAAAVLFVILVWKNNDVLVHAFNQMFGFIPGVGIMEGNEEILYQLKAPVTIENGNDVMEIINVVATEKEIDVHFNYKDQEKIRESENKKETEFYSAEKNISLRVDGQIYPVESMSSSGGGLAENISVRFLPEPEQIAAGKEYTLVYEDYQVSGVFELVDVKQFNRLEDIGATRTLNNISLTAVASREKNALKVNVYPVNYSGYHLISFVSDYDMNYFGRKIVLKTENGSRDYTLPDSYGSGMNAAYTFDISDNAREYTLCIPGIVAESEEEKKVSLPIPGAGETISVNQEVKFEKGTVMITSVEKIIEKDGNEYGDLKINLDYTSTDENCQLLGAFFTRNRSEGWAEEFDENGRLSAIYYRLEESHENKIKFTVKRPKYFLMDEYNLTIIPQ